MPVRLSVSRLIEPEWPSASHIVKGRSSAVVMLQSGAAKVVKPRVTGMSLRAKRSNLPNLGDCHPASGGTDAPRNDSLRPLVTERLQIDSGVVRFGNEDTFWAGPR